VTSARENASLRFAQISYNARIDNLGTHNSVLVGWIEILPPTPSTAPSFSFTPIVHPLTHSPSNNRLRYRDTCPRSK